jgi:hypothetical protein
MGIYVFSLSLYVRDQRIYSFSNRFRAVLTDTNSFCNMVDLLGGAVAQLGECLTGSQEVVGSNPISSTTYYPLFSNICPVCAFQS